MVWKPHVTVAALVEQHGKFLLIEEQSEGSIVLNQPAGHVEDNERFIDAVIRETREEAAWDFLPQHIVGQYYWQNPQNQEIYLRVCYAGIVTQHYPEQTLDEGILRSCWLTLAQLKQADNLRTPLVLRCVTDFLSGARYPLHMLTDLGDIT